MNLELIAITAEKCQLFSSLCSFLRTPVTYSCLAKIIACSNLFSNLFSMFLLCQFDRTNFVPILDNRIIITINPVKTQQFILLLSTTCFGLKGHRQVEDKNKRICIHSLYGTETSQFMFLCGYT